MTGAGGQLGRALRDRLPDAEFLTHSDLDVTDQRAVQSALSGADLVIHCAAMTDVDGCEDDQDTAEAVNAYGAAHVAAAAERMILISTDYVFDGTKDGEYVEDDVPNPINVYGSTKLAAEHAVLSTRRALVVRTSWVFGEGRNFVRSIVNADRNGTALRVVGDQRGRPTHANDLARAVAYLAARSDDGIVHVAGDGQPCTWAELAEAAVGHEVTRVSSEDWGAKAPRPRNSVLSLAKARELGVPLTDWKTSLAAYTEGLR
ncbi:MAG: dTDP-4-dehydrorhamnose 3,5-epimerase/reductase [Gaiellales bacterium]|nr:dTDP-4-dehydrorhamnose 3,5-epimerase/reductase [Gaiellales bacterium]